MEKLKKLILENLHLKILSLLVAFLLWLNITSMQKTKIEFYTPVEIKNVPENIVITKIKPDKVLVVVEGYKTSLTTVDISNIKAFVDGRKIKPGKNILHVSVKSVSGLKIIDVKPRVVLIKALKERKKQ